MAVRITWKKLVDGSTEETKTITTLVRRTIPAVDFAADKASIETADQSRADRRVRDAVHLDVMEASEATKVGEQVFIEYDDAGTVLDSDNIPSISSSSSSSSSISSSSSSIGSSSSSSSSNRL